MSQLNDSTKLIKQQKYKLLSLKQYVKWIKSNSIYLNSIKILTRNILSDVIKEVNKRVKIRSSKTRWRTWNIKKEYKKYKNNRTWIRNSNI